MSFSRETEPEALKRAREAEEERYNKRRRIDDAKKLDEEIQRFAEEIKRMPLGNPSQPIRQDTIRAFGDAESSADYLRRHGYAYLTQDMLYQIPAFMARNRELVNLLRGTVDDIKYNLQQELKKIATEIKSWPRDGEWIDIREYLLRNNYQFADINQVEQLDAWQDWYRDFLRRDIRKQLTKRAYHEYALQWPVPAVYLDDLEQQSDRKLSRDELRQLVYEERQRRGLTSSVGVGVAVAPPPDYTPEPGSSTAGVGGRYHHRRTQKKGLPMQHVRSDVDL